MYSTSILIPADESDDIFNILLVLSSPAAFIFAGGATPEKINIFSTLREMQ
jgi:hypothetical protein